jgi:D-xylose transport system substrate-binding protein
MIKTLFVALVLATAIVLPAGCASERQGLRIGFLMDTLEEERWQRDRDLFVEQAKARGAEVLVQVANGDDALQVQQAENLLTQGVDVLVVVPHNGEVAAAIVTAAKRDGVPVLAYDRMIRNADVDLYVSFDNLKVGEMQAAYLLERAPKGNYVVIGGSPADNNALLYHEGQMKVLDPAVKRGDIKIVADQYSREWLASEALNNTENALTQANNDVVAVVAANDGTASGAVRALEGQGLAGKVFVSGQDAELAALQRIVEGKQSMTVYKPIAPLAARAVEAAVALGRRERVATTQTVNNGKIDVPSILLEPIVVDKANILETVVRDRYHKLEDIYANVPRSEWPQPK